MLNLRQEQKQKTRAGIVQASIDLFSQKGIQSTKTLDIAKSAGVSHGAVFAHFSNKNELLIEVIDEIGRKMSEEFRSIDLSDASLRKTLLSHLSVIEKYESIYRQLLIEGSQLPPEVRGVLLTLQNGIAVHIRQALKTEIRDGLVRSLPPAAFFNSWMGTITYYLVNQDLFAPNRSVISEKKDEIINYFLKLIKL